MKVRYIFDRVCLQIVHFSFLRTLTCFKVQLLYVMVKSWSIHLPKNTTEYLRIPSEDLSISLKDRETDRIFLFPRNNEKLPKTY